MCIKDKPRRDIQNRSTSTARNFRVVRQLQDFKHFHCNNDIYTVQIEHIVVAGTHHLYTDAPQVTRLTKQQKNQVFMTKR